LIPSPHSIASPFGLGWPQHFNRTDIHPSSEDSRNRQTRPIFIPGNSPALASLFTVFGCNFSSSAAWCAVIRGSHIIRPPETSIQIDPHAASVQRALHTTYPQGAPRIFQSLTVARWKKEGREGFAEFSSLPAHLDWRCLRSDQHALASSKQ
jgi:hypothetical protein